MNISGKKGVVLLSFAAIGVAATLVMAVYLITDSWHMADRPATYRDVLVMEDAKLTAYLSAMDVANLEEFEHLWLGYQDSVNGQTNLSRWITVYEKIKSVLRSKGSRGIPNLIEDMPGPFPIKRDPEQEKALKELEQRTSQQGLWGEKGPPSNKKR